MDGTELGRQVARAVIASETQVALTDLMARMMMRALVVDMFATSPLNLLQESWVNGDVAYHRFAAGDAISVAPPITNARKWAMGGPVVPRPYRVGDL
jgi:hypothetical protein